jgi:hypothetical protein
MYVVMAGVASIIFFLINSRIKKLMK